MSVLFSDDIENWFLNMEQTVLCTLHTRQLGIKNTQLLHLQHLVVAGSVVEGVGSLGEVVHDIVLVEDALPG